MRADDGCYDSPSLHLNLGMLSAADRLEIPCARLMTSLKSGSDGGKAAYAVTVVWISAAAVGVWTEGVTRNQNVDVRALK
jgi:hypothetical protein